MIHTIYKYINIPTYIFRVLRIWCIKKEKKGANTKTCAPDVLHVCFIWNVFLCFLGSKTADPCCYGHTQFHLLPNKLRRERLLRQNCADQIEVVFRANAIASLFAWTGAQAMYQGKN